ncbi:Ser-Thr-rich glycosyl-phosphatidyl-inositol-anchored membrane family-domain-containing protein [Phyllosticta citricarpa]|uniref:Ser-Thr-rich glycosyl-phosphatidyl-inositol-anchored membrane family-domain-containing protein n=2 Tax=Phyllosticta TaxID=121621 RepID=A0ABR1MNG2_9PEZI
MRFFTTIVSAFALVATAVAQSASVQITDYPQSVTAGQTYTIKYTATDINKPCTLTLRRGNPNDLTTISTLTTDAVGGSYEWKADSNLKAGTDYAFQIQQGSQINYSGQFGVKSEAVATSGPSTPLMTPTSLSTIINNSTIRTPMTPMTPFNATATPIRTPTGNATVRIPVTPTTPGGGAATTGPQGTGNQAASGTGRAPTGAASSMAASSFGLVFSVVAAMIFLQ